MDSNLDAAILSALDRTEPATAAEIASRLDAHPVTVRRCCEQLQRAGRLKTVTGGAYVCVEFTPDGPVASD